MNMLLLMGGGLEEDERISLDVENYHCKRYYDKVKIMLKLLSYITKVYMYMYLNKH